MKAINPNVYPKGGYQFKDPDGSLHVGDSWAGVIARVKKYRHRQGKPTDGIHDEVIIQACQKHPVLCTEINQANIEQTKRVSLKGRILLWLNKVKAAREQHPLTFVSDQLRAARQDVCSRCTQNQGTPDGCGSCRAALRNLRESIIGKRPFNERADSCAILGEYLPVSTWIEVQTVDNPSLPWECWRKRSV